MKKLSIVTWPCCPIRLVFGIHGSMTSIYDLCPNLMRVQTGNVPYTQKELGYWKNNCIRV